MTTPDSSNPPTPSGPRIPLPRSEQPAEQTLTAEADFPVPDTPDLTSRAAGLVALKQAEAEVRMPRWFRPMVDPALAAARRRRQAGEIVAACRQDLYRLRERRLLSPEVCQEHAERAHKRLLAAGLTDVVPAMSALRALWRGEL